MVKKDSRKLDDLLARAEQLKQRVQQSRERKSVGKAERISDTLTSIHDHLGFFRRLFYNIVLGGVSFYERVLSPVFRVVGPPVVWCARRYGRIWNRVVYRTDRATGARVFSRSRAACMILCTLAFIAAFTPTWLGDAVRFVTVEPITDGIFMATSKRTETFYLNHSEEIDPEHNVHSVRGCKSAGSCSEIDAAYFRIRPRLSHDIWKLIVHGNPIYVPDHVVAPIAPGVNRCEVTYYGYRMTSSWTSRLMRSLELYPTLLETTCVYVGSEESHKPNPPSEEPSR